MAGYFLPEFEAAKPQEVEISKSNIMETLGTAEICIAYWPVTEYSVNSIGKFWIPLTFETTEEDVLKAIEKFATGDMAAAPETMVWAIHDFRGFAEGVEIVEDADLSEVLKKAAVPF
jgi:hypothetical protein